MVSGSVIGVVLVRSFGSRLLRRPQLRSAAGKRAHDLDVVARLKGGRRPFGATYDAAIDGNGEEPSSRVDAAKDQQFAYGRYRKILFDAVDLDAHHRLPPAAA